MNSNVRFLVQALGSIVCFWWLFRMVSPEQLARCLKGSDYSIILLIVAIMPPAILARAWRWYFLLSCRGVQVSPRSIIKATFIGMALNLFLPASAGDVVRSYYGWQQYGHKEEMLATSLSDKVVALLSLFLMGAVGGLLCSDTKLALLAAVFIVPTGFVLAVPFPWLWKVLSMLVNRLFRKDLDVDLLLRSFHMDIRTFSGAFMISVLGWLITNFMYFLAVCSVGAHIGVGYTFAVAPLINLLRMLPISISGLGSADTLMVQLFAGVGIDKQLTLAASMIVNLTLIILPGAIGALLMLINPSNVSKATPVKQIPPSAEV